MRSADKETGVKATAEAAETDATRHREATWREHRNALAMRSADKKTGVKATAGPAGTDATRHRA